MGRAPTGSPGLDLFGGSKFVYSKTTTPHHEVGKEPSRLNDPGVEMLDLAHEADVPTTSSGSEEDAAEMNYAHREVKPPKIPEGYRLLQHSTLKTLYLQGLQNRRVLYCGRLVSEKHGAPTSVGREPNWKQTPGGVGLKLTYMGPFRPQYTKGKKSRLTSCLVGGHS